MNIQWKDTLPEVVLRHAREYPDKNAICTGKKAVSYESLSVMIHNACGNLTALGVKKGDCVVISAVMKAEYIAAFLAVKYMQAVAVPINKTDSQESAEYVIGVCDAKLFLSDNPRYQMKEKHSLSAVCAGSEMKYEMITPQEVGEDDVTEILFTSGTTGKPKGAVLSQSGICASIQNTSDGMDMRAEDVLLLPLPLNHSFGLRVLRAALFNGETIVLQNGFSFAAEMQSNIEYWNCSCLAIVNAGLELIKQQMGDKYKAMLKDMRYIEFSAGAVPAEDRKKLVQDLPNVRLYNTWGSTETGGALFLCFSERTDKIESGGCAINDIELAVIDEHGDQLPQDSGQFGRLAIRSHARLLCYYKDEQLTAETIHGDWLWTNDAARLDMDGYVYLNGRIDDMISVGGEKIAPNAVEKIAQTVPDILECACCGVDDPDGQLGQVPVLFVKKSGELDEKLLIGKLRTEGNGYMVPKEIIYLDEIPKNYMGKVDRKKLGQIWNDSLTKKAVETPRINNSAEIVFDNILTRRSIRNFTEQPVPQDILEQILLAGRMAPSGHNMQTWRFTVLRKKESIERLKDTAQRAAKEKNTLVYGFLNPNVCIVVSNDIRNYDAPLDSGAAMENMLLLSHAYGLGGVWINALYWLSDEPEIRALLTEYGIPATHRVYGTLGLGYPAEHNIKTPVKKDNVTFYYD